MDAKTATDFAKIIRETAIDGQLDRLLKEWPAITPALRSEIINAIQELEALEEALIHHAQAKTPLRGS